MTEIADKVARYEAMLRIALERVEIVASKETSNGVLDDGAVVL